MRALVTGATGFIGSKLVERLKKEKWTVVALVRSKDNLGKLDCRGIKIEVGDLSDFESLEKAVKNIDVVYNVAAALPYHKLSREQYWEVNAQGVENLCRVCVNSRVKRLVHVSTVGIYGKPSPYSTSKLEGEKIIRKYSKRGLKAVILRPTIAYGPGDTRPGFLNLLKLIKKGIFIKIGNGRNYFHTIYIDNLVDALLLGATKRGIVGEDFIIGDEPCPTMNEILSEMEKTVGKKSLPLAIPLPLAFTIGSIFDLIGIGLLNTQRVRFLTEDKKFEITKTKKLLGWKPKVSLAQGIKNTYGWYVQEGFIK